MKYIEWTIILTVASAVGYLANKAQDYLGADQGTEIIVTLLVIILINQRRIK